MASPDNTIIRKGSSITDAQGNTWSINANAQVTENGQLAGNSAGVVEMAYEQRQVWQENDQSLWWEWNPSAPDNYTGWSPSAGTAISPVTPSPDGTIVYPSYGTIIDAQGNTWTINSNERVLVDGQSAGYSSGVVEIAYENGKIWQENGQGLWWQWNPSAPDNYTGWSPLAGTSTSPVTATTRTWLGGGNNAASNPNDWSPAGLPQPGDTLIITQGTIVVSGNDLAGNTLSVLYPAEGGPAPTIDLQNAQIDLNAAPPVPVGGQLTINVAGNDQIGGLVSPGLDYFVPTFNLAANSSVTLTGNNFFFTYSFHGAAGSELINDGTLSYNQTGSIIDTNVAGTGTINVSRAHDGSASLEVNGSVGSGQTFAMRSNSFNASLIVDQPQAFDGNVVVEPDSDFSLASIFLKGLNATSFDLTDDMLKLYSGDKLVDTLRLTNNSGEAMTAQQTGSGVIVDLGNAASGMSGQILPPHVS